MPVYFTAYQQNWNVQPDKVSGNFTVTTTFERNGQSVKNLTSGVPVELKVTVNVKSAASYVMLELPIPAGCSYKEKNQAYANNEVHREYFKNKTSIFCSNLPKGEYYFYVSLIPRYSGSYHLNPANVSMMYFPVFNGREEMKQVNIK